MPEPEPMSWEEADALKPPSVAVGTLQGTYTYWYERTLAAIALARQEKARADKVTQQYEDAGREGFILADGLRVRVDECNKELKELRHKCGCRFEEFSHNPDDPRKGRLLDECEYHAEIRERAEKAEDELRATSKLMEANKRIEDAFVARILSLEARAEKAEKDRDEAISEETDHWEKRALKAEAQLTAAEDGGKRLPDLPPDDWRTG